MAKKSKAYREAIAKVPSEAVAPLEAMKVVKEVATKKFDETVEVHFRLGIDTRQADQQLRGTVSLPNGSGKTVRVAVFAEGAMAEAAKEAGADIVGTEELTQQIQAGEFNFDAAVATPDQMGKVGRLGKILGPRGLMPNPKLGTVTTDVAKAIKELKGGRVEYRADRYGIAHVVLGTVSFTAEQLAENYGTVYDEVLRMKPAAAKCGWRTRSRGRVSARCRGFLRALPCRPAVFTRGWPAMRSTALSGPSGRKAACLPSPRFLSRSFPAPNRIAMARLVAHARRLASISPSGWTSCALKQAGRIAHR